MYICIIIILIILLDSYHRVHVAVEGLISHIQYIQTDMFMALTEP